jgi:radical SAM-linked protein
MNVRVRYAKLGKVRFTSHRDTANHWERALRRSGVSVAMCNGFTPRPRVAFGLGLPTGAESMAEYIDIELVDHADPEVLALRFDASLPAGYQVMAAQEIPRGGPSLQEIVVATSWALTIEGVDADRLSAAVSTAVKATSLPVRRSRKGQWSTDDVRPSVEDLAAVVAADGRHTELVTTLSTQGRGLRPTELVGAILPLFDPLDITTRVLRTQQWITTESGREELLRVAHPAPALPTLAAGRTFS